jgi:broad specificity phosphatase PhoE
MNKQSEWPNVEFDAAMTEIDEGWQPDWRESIENVTNRIQAFFAWLAKRPERRIAIVSHGVWIECMLMHYCPHVLQYGQIRVYNCDIYSGDCLSVVSADKTETRLENMRKIQ